MCVCVGVSVSASVWEGVCLKVLVAQDARVQGRHPRSSPINSNEAILARLQIQRAPRAKKC